MERIAGALEAQNNQERPTDEADQSRRDLAAQENMAHWAFWMFIAAGAGTLLTAFGLLLIWQTVIYTRNAAVSADKMVTEAEKTTAAAVQASNAATAANALAVAQFKAAHKPQITLTMRGPLLETRDYLPMASDDPNRMLTILQAEIRVENTGGPTASLIGLVVYPLSGAQWPYVQDTPEHRRGPQGGIFYVLNRGERVLLHQDRGVLPEGALSYSTLGTADLSRETRPAFIQAPPPIVGYLEYTSPLGQRYRYGFGFVPTNPHGDGAFERYGGAEYNYDREIEA
jgi:hypothetical protein